MNLSYSTQSALHEARRWSLQDLRKSRSQKGRKASMILQTSRMMIGSAALLKGSLQQAVLCQAALVDLLQEGQAQALVA